MLAILSTTPAVHSSAELYEPAAAATAPYPTAGGVSRRATGGGGSTRRRRGPRAVVPPAQPGPSVVLLYHIEKTGGSAVMKWLKRQTHAPSRLAAVYSYSQTSCFFALHADLFPGMEPRWRDKLCGGAAPLDWRSSKVAVEFHSYRCTGEAGEGGVHSEDCRPRGGFVPQGFTLRVRIGAARG